jgi:hypothetical protein
MKTPKNSKLKKLDIAVAILLSTGAFGLAWIMSHVFAKIDDLINGAANGF